MAFRADESAANGYNLARKYLIPVNLPPKIRARSEEVLLDIIDELGPVVDAYPSWHPLVSKHDERYPATTPSEQTGYKGLDHTCYFAHGFITCPYSGARDVISSARAINHHCASITAKELDVTFYSESVTPVLVKCEWTEPLQIGNLIRKKVAVPLMIEQAVPVWRWSTYAERWDVMRPYFLGQPHGSRSSLFVDQETALAMKKVYLSMVESGMFGPVIMD